MAHLSYDDGKKTKYPPNGIGSIIGVGAGSMVGSSGGNKSYTNSDIQQSQSTSGGSNPYYDKWLALEADRNAGIAAEERAAERRLREQIAQGVNTLEAQLPELKKQYEVGAQDAYRMLMQSKKNMPEMLAAQGYHGGASETATAMLETENGNRLNGLQDQYNSGVSGINRDIANLRSSGNIAIAENASKYAQELRNASLTGQQELAALMQQMQSAGGGNAGGDNNLTLDQIIRAKNAGLSGAALDDALGKMGLQYSTDSNITDKQTQNGTSLTNDDYAASLRSPAVQNWLTSLNNNEKFKPPRDQQDRDAQRRFALQSAYNQGLLRDNEFMAIAQKLGMVVE